MKRTLKLALGYSIHSLFPIISWLIWGILKDQDYASTFILTYPIQFIGQITLVIFGYGVETYAATNKEQKKNIVLSGLLLGTGIYAIIFVLGALFSKPYMLFMGYKNMKLLIPCRYSMLIFIPAGIASLLSLYYNFKENYQKGSRILTEYNIVTYGTLISTMLITDEDIVIISFSLFMSFIYIFYNLFNVLKKELKGFKFIFRLKKTCSYVLGEIATELGLLITYTFGISNLTAKDFSVVLTLSIWTQALDWIWDALGNIIPTMTRIDTTKGDFNYKQNAKNIAKLNLLFCAIVAVEISTLSIFYDLNMKWIMIFALFDITDLFVYIFQSTSQNYLSTIGFGKKIMIINILGYVLRISLTLSMVGAFGLYFAQLSAGVFKTIINNILYIKERRKQSKRSIG